jgi:hypothetical protein
VPSRELRWPPAGSGGRRPIALGQSATSDRETYFERCWPNAQRLERFEFVRLIEDGDEVVLTYEATRTDGTSFRNTEVLTFEGDKMKRTEVYFGWNLE